MTAFVHLPVRVGGAGLAEDDRLNAQDFPLEHAMAGACSILGAMIDCARAPEYAALA